MKTEKIGGVAGGEGECGDDVAGWLVRERRSLDILPVKKEACAPAGFVALCTRSTPVLHHCLFMYIFLGD